MTWYHLHFTFNGPTADFWTVEVMRMTGGDIFNSFFVFLAVMAMGFSEGVSDTDNRFIYWCCFAVCTVLDFFRYSCFLLLIRHNGCMCLSTAFLESVCERSQVKVCVCKACIHCFFSELRGRNCHSDWSLNCHASASQCLKGLSLRGYNRPVFRQLYVCLQIAGFIFLTFKTNCAGWSSTYPWRLDVYLVCMTDSIR